MLSRFFDWFDRTVYGAVLSPEQAAERLSLCRKLAGEPGDDVLFYEGAPTDISPARADAPNTRIDVLAAAFAEHDFDSWGRLTEPARDFWRDQARPVLRDIDSVDDLRRIQAADPSSPYWPMPATLDDIQAHKIGADCPQCGRDITPAPKPDLVYIRVRKTGEWYRAFNCGVTRDFSEAFAFTRQFAIAILDGASPCFTLEIVEMSAVACRGHNCAHTDLYRDVSPEVLTAERDADTTFEFHPVFGPEHTSNGDEIRIKKEPVRCDPLWLRRMQAWLDACQLEKSTHTELVAELRGTAV